MNDTLIIAIGILAFGISIFAIFLALKFRKEQKDEDKVYEETKATEVKKTVDFFKKRSKVEEKPKKTFGDIELQV